MIGLIFFCLAVESKLEAYSTNFLNNCTKSDSVYISELSINPYPLEDVNTKISGSVVFLVEGIYSGQLVVEYKGEPQDIIVPFLPATQYVAGQTASFNETKKLKNVHKIISGISVTVEILFDVSVVASCNVPLKVNDFALALIGSFFVSFLI